MFSDRRRLRRWAAQVLLVWLFGIAMGVANACALGDSAYHRADATQATGVPDHQYGGWQNNAAKVNCLDFCEKSSIGAPQLKVTYDSFAAFGFALPVSHSVAMPRLAEATVGRLVVDSPHLHGGPPPRIAFQRLAL